VTARRELSRPRRMAVALAELCLATGAVWLALQCWPRGVATITLEPDDGAALVSTRYFGDWIAAAIGLGTVSGLLVLDALRHIARGLWADAGRRRAPS
jgi:uncharacterized membrane protein